MPEDLILHRTPPADTRDGATDRLHGDCANCFGLCCVIPAFGRSADFAIDKAAGTACHNLGADFRCTIHERLRETGFHGCTVYDCFGAGQQVSNVTYGGQPWARPAPGPDMSAVFYVMRQLHELLWHLREALGMDATCSVHQRLSEVSDDLDEITGRSPDALLALDVSARRAAVAVLLRQASELARPGPGPDHAGADLVGADLRGADLRRASLRGALLVGARLGRADLRGADLIGADLRGADLTGADLAGALFVTQAQLDSARGDASTTLPAGRHQPRQWTALQSRLESPVGRARATGEPGEGSANRLRERGADGALSR